MATIHITNISDLQAIEDNLAGDYVIDNDISGNFTPIMDTFTGTIDGQNHVLTLTIGSTVVTQTPPPTPAVVREYSFMFYEIDGSTISNIVFRNCTATADSTSTNSSGNVAILARACSFVSFANLVFENCHVSSYGGFAGILCSEFNGTAYRIYIDDDCSITGGACFAGMMGSSVSGIDESSIIISECDIRGTINVTARRLNYDTNDYISYGGFAEDAQNIAIENCAIHVNFNIDRTDWDIGEDTVDCRIGGVVFNFLYAEEVMTNCYYHGTISQAGNEPELYGIAKSDNPDGSGSAVSCYWLSSCGGSGGLGTSKSDSQLKVESTFSGWNFNTIWGITPEYNGGYPFLLWTLSIITLNIEIETLPATEVWATGATIHGLLHNNTAIPWYGYMGFQWGTSSLTDDGYIAWSYSGNHSSIGYTPIQATISGLLPDRTYYYRACLHVGTPPMNISNYFGSTLSFGGPVSIFGQGWEYVTAKKAEDDISKLAAGRYYMDKSGNFVYESAKHRDA
jgi:hypothetical protein